MAAVTIHSDFGAPQKKKSVAASTFSPSNWRTINSFDHKVLIILILHCIALNIKAAIYPQKALCQSKLSYIGKKIRVNKIVS